MPSTKCLFFLSFIAAATAAHANLVFNGSFEVNSDHGGAADTADGWTNFTDVSGSSSPDVWDNNGVDGIAPGSFGFFPHISAFHGTKFASIASRQDGFSEGVESTAMALSAGSTYRLTVRTAYDSHNGGGWNNPAPLTARLRKGGGPSSVLTVFAPHTADHVWELRSIDFSVGATDSYSLILSSESLTVQNYFVIDDVSVVDLVPEPASVAALGLGTLVLLRRKKA